MKMPATPAKQSVTMDLVLTQVRDLVVKTSDTVLATMYREIAQANKDTPQGDGIDWSEVVELCNMSNDHDVAIEFKSWMEKAARKVSDLKILKQFMLNIASGILEVARRS